MIVVSDTNILSSLAAGDALPALLHVFRRATFCIPPSVRDELQVGLAQGRTYLEPIFRAITTQQIVVVALSSDEEHVLQGYPQRLNLGERQAIALAQTRNAVVLSNDRRALRYCQQQHIRVVNLIGILRLRNGETAKRAKRVQSLGSRVKTRHLHSATPRRNKRDTVGITISV